ncbi:MULTISPECIES: hypothetical protein [Saccharibacillus]|uniref:hypothetical protein n=1 Tax=Saccharibacillus TaxID=456492 RepID=UPI001238D32D|nr:hypothetical protein [Saccharibacillus sp. WB 17]MWJ31431.1 hypothetical protein [Saccharibacillus sp. WB 17]
MSNSLPNPSAHSLESQLAKLRELGIHGVDSDADMILRLTKYVGAAYYEQQPYLRLLAELGHELSPNVWTFDVECVESADVYENAISKMIALAEGRIEIGSLQGKFDPAEDWTRIDLVHAGQSHELNAAHNGDWFDMDVLGRVERIVRMEDWEFLHRWEDQTVTLVFIDRAASKELIRLTDKQFGPLI